MDFYERAVKKQGRLCWRKKEQDGHSVGGVIGGVFGGDVSTVGVQLVGVLAVLHRKTPNPWNWT
jgi:hypothetical protein